MADLPLSQSEFERFEKLSKWAEDWLRFSLPAIIGVDPRTGEQLRLNQIADRLNSCRPPGSNVRQLGEFGPAFCRECFRLWNELELAATRSGPLVSRMGFILDESDLDSDDLRAAGIRRNPLGEKKLYHSAHAAAAYWINEIGALLYNHEPWRHAVENGSPFEGPYFKDANACWEAWCCHEKNGEKWGIEDVARQTRRVCWVAESPDAQTLFVRMSHERSLLKEMLEQSGPAISRERGLDDPPPALTASEKKTRRIERVRNLCREHKLTGEWAALRDLANKDVQIGSLGLPELTREAVQKMCKTLRRPKSARKNARKS